MPIGKATIIVRRLRADGWTIATIAEATGLGYATVGRVSPAGKYVDVATYRRIAALAE